VPSTGLGIFIGTLVGTIAAALIRPLIAWLRGVYFAVVTIAVFYFITIRCNSVTGGDDGLTGWTRTPLNFGMPVSIYCTIRAPFYYLILAVFAVATGAMGNGLALSARHSGARCLPFARTSVALVFWACRLINISGCPG
jgi:branched-chain amino acid transport system permease protein